MIRQLRFIVLAGALFGGLAGSGPLTAQVFDIGLQRFDVGLKTLAEKLARTLKERGETSLIVGDFKPQPGYQASAGPGIKKRLVELLQGENIAIEKNGKLMQLEGKYSATDENKESEFKITAYLLDANNKELLKIEQNVAGVAVGQMIGVTVDLPASAGVAERTKTEMQRITVPSAAVVNQVETRPAESSRYGIEVLVKNGPQWEARRPQIKDGMSYIQLNKNDVYRVRLHNGSKHDAAVLLTIDGLSMFAFSEDKVLINGQVIVAKNGFLDVTGWYFKAKDVREFHVVGYMEGDTGLGLAPNVGVITATFSAAWDVGDAKPDDETGAGSKGVKTGFGNPTGQSFTVVKKTIGKRRSVISVRYDR